MLIEKSLREYIHEAASGNPTPGGGSVSALAGSLGSALTQMVGNLTFYKKSFEELEEERQRELRENFQLLGSKLENLCSIVDEDSRAFDDVLKAFKMPKDTEEERKRRSQAIQEGYKKALEVPLRCAEECLEVLRLQLPFAVDGNINAITDVGVGALLAYAGLEGALMNVRINLLSIKDEGYREDIRDRIREILEEGKRLRDELLRIVYERLDG
ncbi:MAG: cyclodeaminase/cyclohydrolase family protein [Tissierellia bacterium]|nr:cyclodeaminase/cyclohydrolase family protein [Tissierellia bacterium]